MSIESTTSILTAADTTGTSLSPNSINNNDETWRMWCRLCAKDEAQVNLSLFIKNEEEQSNQNTAAAGGLNRCRDLSLPKVIEKYFDVHIKHDHNYGLPEKLCTECFLLVTSLIRFSESVSKVQNMYEVLHNASLEGKHLNAYELRLKYDILENDGDQYLPEVHYVDSKPKAKEMAQNILDEGTDEGMEDPFNDSNITHTMEEISTNEKEVKKDNKKVFNTNDGDLVSDKINVDTQEEIPLKTLAMKMKVNKKISASKMRLRVKKCKNNNAVKNEKSNASDDGNKSTANFFSCNECLKKFKNLKDCRRHVQRVHCKVLKPSLQCQQCPRVFQTQQHLDRHSEVHLPVELRKLLPCPYCDKKFTLNSLKRQHMKVEHVKERTFICEECGVAVLTNVALKEHMLTHTDYAPFECKVCKKSFKNQVRLKNHMEIHDPNKHTCPDCGLQLNSRTTFNRHLLVHTDEKHHKCDYCGREFKRVKTLKNHLILHTGLKPYSCDFCDRTFANGSNCRTHKKKAHPEELAALEAAGGVKKCTRNIPKLEALKAVTKDANNLTPVVPKQSGCFAFRRKLKPQPKIFDVNLKKSSINAAVETVIAAAPNTEIDSAMTNIEIDLNPLNSSVPNADLITTTD